MFDTDAASARSTRMWQKLGGLFEKAAYKRIEGGFYDYAMRCAQMADVCFWQATGDGDVIRMKDVVPKPGSDQ